MSVVLRAGEIAKEAGQLVQRLSMKRDLMVMEKGSANDFVTEADLGSQNLIKELVERYYPGDRVIGEEDGMDDEDIIRTIENNPKGTRLWLVDPLDGTINYIRGIMGYGVSIGVFDGNETIAGAIYQPDTDALYTAEPGSGAWKNGKRIHVSGFSKLSECIGGTHIPVSDMNWRAHTNIWNEAVCANCQNLRMLGASVYEQTRVAAGGIDFYYEIGPHPWDLAAGRLIVEEAGGIATRLDGQPFDYGMGGIIVASKAIHPEVVRMLAEADPKLNELR